MKTFFYISMILLIIGGLNWLLVGLFSFNLVSAIFGSMSVLTRLTYVLVGISAIVILFQVRSLKNCAVRRL